MIAIRARMGMLRFILSLYEERLGLLQYSKLVPGRMMNCIFNGCSRADNYDCGSNLNIQHPTSNIQHPTSNGHHSVSSCQDLFVMLELSSKTNLFDAVRTKYVLVRIFLQFCRCPIFSPAACPLVTHIMMASSTVIHSKAVQQSRTTSTRNCRMSMRKEAVKPIFIQNNTVNQVSN